MNITSNQSSTPGDRNGNANAQEPRFKEAAIAGFDARVYGLRRQSAAATALWLATRCTAQGARDQVLLIGLETTFREKLEWLEEAETLALRLQGKLRDDESLEVILRSPFFCLSFFCLIPLPAETLKHSSAKAPPKSGLLLRLLRFFAATSDFCANAAQLRGERWSHPGAGKRGIPRRRKPRREACGNRQGEGTC